MMRALARREAERIAASGGLGTAIWLHAAWLSWFLAVWSGGDVPLFPGVSIDAQLLRVQWMLMIVLLPWAATRLVPAERGDAFVRAAACLGVRPSRMLAARIVTLSASLVGVVAAGLPMAVLAQRISDAPIARVFVDQGAVAACAVASAVMVVALQQVIVSRVGVWLAATAASCGVAALVNELALPAAIFGPTAATAAVAGAMLTAARGDVSLRYLSEQTA
jgi:hypothetical protein